MKPARDPVRSTALEAALVDLERALVRDRCHVVVSASTGPARALLLGALAERVAGALRVIPVPTTKADTELCAAILRELGEPCGEDAESSLVGVIQRLASQGSALALVAGDASSLSQPVLRRLGRLAALARRGLRLVLVSNGSAGSDRDAIAEFMTPLGIGAVKVVLDTRPRERPAAGERPAPPRLVPPAPQAARPVGRAVVRRAPHFGPQARRVARFALFGVATAALGLVAVNRIEIPAPRTVEAPSAQVAASPAPAHEAPPPPADVEAPASTPRRAPAPAKPVRRVPAVAAPAPRAALAAAAEARSADAVPASAPSPDATAARALEVATALSAAAPGPVAPESPAAPATERPPRKIRVSLNAQPWAHIEVDGRDVGVTPMADLQLSEGPHRFRARFPDGRVLERTVRVDAVRDHITFP